MSSNASRVTSAAATRVWDRTVRLVHWGLVLLVVAAWFTKELRGPTHQWLGYGAAALVALRVVWGFTGGRRARFAQFFSAPAATWTYSRAVLAGHAPRYLGHNPLGGWMVLALLVTLGALCLSGWLFTTDWLWGYAWLENTHAVLGWLLVGFATLHVAGVAFTSWHQRENLVRAMIDGHKRAAAPGDEG